MTLNSSIVVIVPAHNEAPIISSTLERLIELNYSVVVVDDGSVDNTWEVITYLNVFALRHPINLGQGAAIQTGTTFALRNGAEIIVHFDADGQHKAEDIEVLIEPLLKKQADVVFGSRFLRKTDTQLVPASRRLLLKIGILFNGLSTGIW